MVTEDQSVASSLKRASCDVMSSVVSTLIVFVLKFIVDVNVTAIGRAARERLRWSAEAVWYRCRMIIDLSIILGCSIFLGCRIIIDVLLKI